MQLAFKFDNWSCPICGQDTKPDWWSEDGYSCMDCGPVLEVEYEEPPLINFFSIYACALWAHPPKRIKKNKKRFDLFYLLCYKIP